MAKKTTSIPPWEIRTLMCLHTGRFVGYTVQRIHNPYTPHARAEMMDRGRVYPTEGDALDAIARAVASCPRSPKSPVFNAEA